MHDFPEACFTGRDFRDALSAFATGVTIVTARDAEGGPVGMTASSFNSVSVDPPLVLWSVGRDALSAPAFTRARHFAVHVLASDQSDLSNRFSRSGTDKFAGLDFEDDARGVPVLAGAASRFDCTTWAVHDGGDHHIIVGRVDALEATAKEGLVFGGGTYATAAPLVSGERQRMPADDAGGLIEDLLFYQLSRAYHQMGAAFHEAVRGSGLTVAEWRISASLFDGTTRDRADLCRRTFLDPNALDDVLAGMVADGLCTLEGSDGVRATKKGRDTVAHLFSLAEEQEAAALDGLAPDDAAAMKAALARVADNTA